MRPACIDTIKITEVNMYFIKDASSTAAQAQLAALST